MRKVGVYIDGSNLWGSTQALNIRCDWKKLQEWLAAHYEIYKVNYYTAVRTEEDGFTPMRKMLDYIEYSGIRVVQKPVRVISRGHSNEALIKGNMDVELATDMILGADYYNHMMLFSGDGDFAYLVHKLRERGIHVIVVSSTAGESAESNMLGDTLRRACDTFINLAEWKELKLPFISASDVK